MKIIGNSIGNSRTIPDMNETNPNSAAYIKNKPPRIVIGSEKPEGPAFWFNTAPDASTSAATLALVDDEEGYPVQASIEGETYGVPDISLNGSAPEKQYNFTVL